MSCETTIPAYFTDPKLDNRITQLLQQTLRDECTWCQVVYPAVRKGYIKTSSGAVVRPPQVYMNDGGVNNLEILPNAKLTSFMFFTLNNAPIVQQDEENGYEFSLYGWYDLTKIDTGRPYDYSRELIADVLRVLNGNADFQKRITDLSYEADPSKVFPDFDLLEDQVLAQMYPFGAFRIDFTYTDFTELECEPFEVIGGDTCVVQMTACELLLNTLTENQKNQCILPSYDFSDPEVYDNLTPEQIADLNTSSCTPVTIRNLETGATITTVPAGGTYDVLVFSEIVDNGPPYSNSIIDQP